MTGRRDTTGPLFVVRPSLALRVALLATAAVGAGALVLAGLGVGGSFAALGGLLPVSLGLYAFNAGRVLVFPDRIERIGLRGRRSVQLATAWIDNRTATGFTLRDADGNRVTIARTDTNAQTLLEMLYFGRVQTCPGCGYDLRGSPAASGGGSVCPECGTVSATGKGREVKA